MAENEAPNNAPITTIDKAVEQLYDLNVGTVGTGSQRHERPHKPILLLTVMDLIANGTATPDNILWSEQLRSTFRKYFEKIRRLNDSDTPENPFVYLRSDGFWNPVVKTDNVVVPLDHPPTVSEAREAKVSASFPRACRHLSRTQLIAPASVKRSFRGIFRRPALRLSCSSKNHAWRWMTLIAILWRKKHPRAAQVAIPLFAERSWKSTTGSAPLVAFA